MRTWLKHLTRKTYSHNLLGNIAQKKHKKDGEKKITLKSMTNKSKVIDKNAPILFVSHHEYTHTFKTLQCKDKMLSYKACSILYIISKQIYGIYPDWTQTVKKECEF